MMFNIEQFGKRETTNETPNPFGCAKLIPVLVGNQDLQKEGGQTSVIYGREIGSAKEGGST
jgi:hypothetical protein